jgi:hypothetical protein
MSHSNVCAALHAGGGRVTLFSLALLSCWVTVLLHITPKTVRNVSVLSSDDGEVH